MGVNKLPNHVGYWSTNPGLRNPLICRTLTIHQFETLSKWPGCCDPKNDPDTWPTETTEQKKHQFCKKMKYPHYPVKPVWEVVLAKCLSNFHPPQQLAMDKAMIGYKGFKAVVRKVFMQGKPTRYGFKLYAVATTGGYMLIFLLHKTSRVKTTLADIAYKTMEPFLNKSHHFYTDKAYTGVALANKLRSKATYLTGSIKTNAAKLPSSLSGNPNKNPERYQIIREMNKTRRGTIYVRQKGNLTYTLWEDSKIVSILSNAYNGFRNKTTDFVTRNYSTDGVAAATQQQVAVAVDYNKHMGGVDRSDQLRSYYSTARKSNIWWRQLLYFLLDIAMTNAYICAKFYRPNLTHLDFTMEVVDGLINGYFHQTAKQRKFKSQQPRKAKPVPENQGPAHYLVRMDIKFGKQFAECKRSGRHQPSVSDGVNRKPIVSRFGCQACGIHLCRTTVRNCFRRYHSPFHVNVIPVVPTAQHN